MPFNLGMANTATRVLQLRRTSAKYRAADNKIGLYSRPARTRTARKMKFPPKTSTGIPFTLARQPAAHRSVTSSQPSAGQETLSFKLFGYNLRICHWNVLSWRQARDRSEFELYLELLANKSDYTFTICDGRKHDDHRRSQLLASIYKS